MDNLEPITQNPTNMSLCPNPEVCGSCGWSHITYENQLKQKLADINGSFAIKKLKLEVKEIIPSPKTSHYRNRMDFVIDWQGNVGLREKGKWWKVIDDHTCFLADKKIEAIFSVTRDWAKTCGLSFYDRKANVGLLRYAVIRSTTLGETMVNIVTSAPVDETESKKIISAIKSFAGLSDADRNDGDAYQNGGVKNPALAISAYATTIVWSINHTISDVSYGDEIIIISGSGYIEEEIAGFRYRISPNAFFQTNPHGAALLLETVREFATNHGGSTHGSTPTMSIATKAGLETPPLRTGTLLDLYCGTGFFAIALAQYFAKTIGVEMVPEAIRDAQVNAELNRQGGVLTPPADNPAVAESDRSQMTEKTDRTYINNSDNVIEFHDAKTEDFDWKKLGADVVILDPPRSGMVDKALQDVIAARPETIVYISCNYKNFAREMVILQDYYTVEAIKAIDMFPHTPHVELVTKLVRK